MSVMIEVTQTKTTEPGPVYRVVNVITDVTDIPPELFVIATTTDTFSHVATVWDLQNYPTTKVAAVANNDPYYLSDTGTREYARLQDGMDFAAVVVSRLEWLARDYTKAIDEFQGVVVHVITG